MSSPPDPDVEHEMNVGLAYMGQLREAFSALAGPNAELLTEMSRLLQLTLECVQGLANGPPGGHPVCPDNIGPNPELLPEIGRLLQVAYEIAQRPPVCPE